MLFIRLAMVTAISGVLAVALSTLSAEANDRGTTPVAGSNQPRLLTPRVTTWRGDYQAWQRAVEAERRRGNIGRAEQGVYIGREINNQANRSASQFVVHPMQFNRVMLSPYFR
jgi:hypothetical protein